MCLAHGKCSMNVKDASQEETEEEEGEEREGRRRRRVMIL